MFETDMKIRYSYIAKYLTRKLKRSKTFLPLFDIKVEKQKLYITLYKPEPITYWFSLYDQLNEVYRYEGIA